MGSKQFWKFSGSFLGLLALLAILISANIIIGRVRMRADLTEEKLYTLSNGTRLVLNKLNAPITLKFFFSGSSPQTPLPLKQFAQQVLDLLKEYEIAGSGNVIVEQYDPRPDSDDEEWAQRYGLIGEQMGPMEPPLFLGLVAVMGENHAVLPFIDPRNERLLEYNITHMLTQAAHPQRPVVGILSSLPVMGVRSFPYAMPGQPRPKSQPPWVAFQELARSFETRQVPSETESIAEDINVLVIVHPKDLSDRTLFAIDQFVLRGGRLLVFMDPMCLADAMSQENAMMGMQRPASDLAKLLDAWNVSYDPDMVVADLDASTRIRRHDNSIEENPVFLTLRQPNIDGQDIITTALTALGMPAAGSFSVSATEGVSVASLLVSSEQAQMVHSMNAQMGADAIRRDFRSGLKRLNLAVRLHGKFKTAFPAGKPAEQDKPDAEPKPAEPATEPALTESVEPGTIILVGDADMLYDPFATQEIPLFGQRVFQPINDNLNFLNNAVEQLAGSTDLISIRSRGRLERPFDRVIELQREAQQRWLAQERMLQEQLEMTRQRLENLQATKDKSQRYILSAEQEQEINKFKQEQIKTQRDLRQVRKNLREGIERLGITVKAVNILLMPVLVCLIGLLLAWQRRRKINS